MKILRQINSYVKRERTRKEKSMPLTISRLFINSFQKQQQLLAMGTQRDKNVLGMILNPMCPDQLFQNYESECAEAKPDMPNIEQCEQLEIKGVKMAESDNFEEALSKLDEAIAVCPTNPSPFNNRAQVHRLQGNITEAFNDLEKSIELSGGKGKSALQAYNQRAIIHRLQGDDDKAREDYEKAASLGSKFAKMQLVALNPYAAMCNAMLSKVLNKTHENASNRPDGHN